MMLPPLKPWIDVQDADGNVYTIPLDEQRQKIKNGLASLYAGKVQTKSGAIIEVKIARAMRSAFSGRFVRVQGPATTTAGEIAAQLNTLFAEE